MFRVLLTAYMTAVMLAGPSACCCTTTRVLAEQVAEPTGQRESGHERHACCCGHGGSQDGEDSAADAGQSCPSPLDEQHDCPCHKNRAHVVAEARDQVVDLSQFRSIVPAPLDVASTVLTDVELIAFVSNPQVANRASHFGTASELLRALRTWLI